VPVKARNLQALADSPFDVLVVGGGIQGLMTAYDTAARGLRVALIDSGDFGAATSSNHQRTAHGGLRSLQTGRLDLARAAIRERRALARIAPRLLRPLPFIIGTYRSWTKNRLALRAAFQIDRWLARDRNEGLEPELHLPPPRLTSRAATLKLFPGVPQRGLTGGAMWYDYQIVHTNRFAIGVAMAAELRSAQLANYVEAITALRESGSVAGMHVRDVLTGAEFDIHARLTINAAGAYAGAVMRMFGVNRDVPLLKAMNLVTSRHANDIALAGPDARGRMLTLTPWHGRALIGTAQTRTFVSPNDAAVTEREIADFVADANTAFPALKLHADEVTLVHRGIVPARQGNGGAELLGEPRMLDHAPDGAPGAMTVIGVKYTTARGVAARVGSAAVRRLAGGSRSVDTDRAVLPGAGIADHEALAIETARSVGLEIAPPIVRHLTGLYGERCAAIVRLMAEQTDWRMPLLPGEPNVGAEIVYVIREEMAMTLADIMIRRTELGAAGYPGDALVDRAAAIAATELGWTADRRAREVAAVREFYTWQT
jgi:glycerol-3-phosphate dehydrogenase